MSAISLASVVVKSPDQVSTNLGHETVILGLASEEYDLPPKEWIDR
jgi:hypothetical protein